uniref:Large ribosomal subunit protein uL16m n=1 Tax=Acrobeloides nanus TaxID=290746 RepID=A0A914DKV0_9BILA
MKTQLLFVPRRLLEFNRCMKKLPFPVNKDGILFPPEGAVKLAEMPKQPTLDETLGETKHVTNRRYIEARGVEQIHTELTYKQFGLATVSGGFITTKNFDFLVQEINKHLRDNQFAIWRVEPPWLPRTQRATGKKLGGGKPGVKYYVTPVRAKRIILEVGGAIDEFEAKGYLSYLVNAFGFPVEFISQRILEERKKEDEEVQQLNKNKFNWETAIKWNMQNCSNFLSDYDITWKAKYK